MSLHFIDFEVFKHDFLCVIANPITKTETVIVNDPDQLRAYYEKFKNEMDRLHELKYPLDKRDTVTLVGLLNEILKIRDTSRKCENVLLNSLTNLTSEELDELKKQHDDYIEALDYRDGAHYRHS